MSASADRAKRPTPGVRKRDWFIPAHCARRSGKPPRRCFSRKAMCTRIPRPPKRASRASLPAINIRVSPIRRLRCSSSAWPRFEGAEAARATATGMAAVTAALLGQLKAGDHIVAAKALFGSCRYVVEDFLPRYGIPCTLVDGTDLEQWRKAVRPNTKTFFFESPTNPTLEVIDIEAVAKIAHRGRRDAGGRQRVRDADVSKPAQIRRRLRGLFGDQAYRRAGALPRRRDPRVREIHPGQCPYADPPDRAVALAVQRMGLAEGT